MLKHLGRVFFVGEKPGLGQTLKLANNLMSQAAIAITSEALAFGVKAGLDPQLMLDVINVSSGRNTASAEKFPKHVLTRGFDFGFSAGLAYKDVRHVRRGGRGTRRADDGRSRGLRAVLAQPSRRTAPIPIAPVSRAMVEERAGCEISSSEETNHERDLYQRGLQIRKAVLGEEYVEKALAACRRFQPADAGTRRPSTAGAASGVARVSRGATAA